MKLVLLLPVEDLKTRTTKWFTRVLDDALPVVVGDHVEVIPGGARVRVLQRVYLPELRAYEVCLAAQWQVPPVRIEDLPEAGWEATTR